MTTLANQPAFPGGITSPPKPSDDCYPTQEGMTLRQYYAGLAMQGLMAQSNESMLLATRKEAQELGEMRWAQTFAREAVEMADALIAKLEESK